MTLYYSARASSQVIFQTHRLVEHGLLCKGGPLPARISNVASQAWLSTPPGHDNIQTAAEDYVIARPVNNCLSMTVRDPSTTAHARWTS